MSNPYVPQSSSLRYFIPKTLESDFDRFLENDIPGAVMDFTLLTDWYDQFQEDYFPTVIRGEIYPDSTKSRYSDTDNNLNFRASKSSGIKKGDIVVDPDGTIYLFDWEVPTQPNNRMTRAVRCNVKLTFRQYKQEEIDQNGYLISEKGYVDIVSDMPCNAYRYDGRPEYASVSGTPGVAPNALTIVHIQYNDQTKQIRIDDEFVWGNQTYTVIDVNRVGINIDNTSGIITVQCKKKAGGMVAD